MTSSNQIRSRVARVVGRELRANLTEHDLGSVMRLDELIAVDSIGLVKFALGLEDEFGISLANESFDRDFLLDVARLTAYLETQRK